MAVDAGLLTNNLGEVKYNKVPDVSAIANNFASMQGTQAQTNRTNILAQGDQLEYNNKVGAQNALANPDLQGQDLIKAAAPFGETGMKMASAKFGTQTDFSKMTSENMDAASKILPTIVDQASLDKANEWTEKNFGVSHLPKIYDEVGKQQIQQMGIGLAKIQEQTLAMMKNQQEYGFKNAELKDKQDRTQVYKQMADNGTMNAGASVARSASAGPMNSVQAKIFGGYVDRVDQFARVYPDHVAELQNINNSINALDKETNQGGPITGGLAEQRVKILNSLSSVYDLTPEQKQTLSNSQNLQQTLKEIVSQAAITTPVKGKQGLTDADLKFVEGVKNGTIELTVDNLKKVLRIGANTKVHYENSVIKDARAVAKSGKITSSNLQDFANKPLRSMLSYDGLTLISPDGRTHTFEKPDQAKTAYEDFNRELEQEAKDGSY